MKALPAGNAQTIKMLWPVPLAGENALLFRILMQLMPAQSAPNPWVCVIYSNQVSPDAGYGSFYVHPALVEYAQTRC